jgi:hypothetical protein
MWAGNGGATAPTPDCLIGSGDGDDGLIVEIAGVGVPPAAGGEVDGSPAFRRVIDDDQEFSPMPGVGASALGRHEAHGGIEGAWGQMVAGWGSRSVRFFARKDWLPARKGRDSKRMINPLYRFTRPREPVR